MLTLFSIFTFLLSLFGYNPDKQLNDPKAKVLLDAVSKTYKNYESVEANFTLISTNPQQNKSSNQKGTVYLKGEKYKLLMGKQEIICDKKSVWTYLKDIKEVQINDYEPNKEDITPSNMFTIYQNDFNYILNGEDNIDKTECTIIDLMPKDKNKPFFKVRIWINKNAKFIKQMKVFDKNGSTYTYTVTLFNSKAGLEDNFFKFDTSKHPEVHVEDLRM
ncbi:MAG TPA: outer membrane lipoprotein carrier protein LolA [Chitinophagales bacterium]|jgi:outer membrane lipoprotein carrier protein|nr:outer membrane lipoprotein carrier protein LolA [Chitinophagales bacterium]MBP6154504.1 outer membrane lipoprotein carrier protein LolA [Chitinophagales bacterium]HQV78715.1 outer membrane lipoprotein carrier protein LolA [Chitinophagales bacterium]HQW79081.1 outer membrane lipoprotein carrier protein LolA [Chitinophagales bacterium]HRB18696.1 outer membrane lipoprotein carrier protein LolA [Chitinophagales bacterium]